MQIFVYSKHYCVALNRVFRNFFGYIAICVNRYGKFTRSAAKLAFHRGFDSAFTYGIGDAVAAVFKLGVLLGVYLSYCAQNVRRKCGIGVFAVGNGFHIRACVIDFVLFNGRHGGVAHIISYRYGVFD